MQYDTGEGLRSMGLESPEIPSAHSTAGVSLLHCSLDAKPQLVLPEAGKNNRI